MLVPVKEASDYEEQGIGYWLAGWIAIDTDNRLAMQATRGRGKGGISHYVVFGWYVDDKGIKRSDHNGRIGSKIAAWDDQEAIDKANARLAGKKTCKD